MSSSMGSDKMVLILMMMMIMVMTMMMVMTTMRMMRMVFSPPSSPRTIKYSELDSTMDIIDRQ